MDNERIRKPAPDNIKGDIHSFLQEYERDRGFVHGFQKDVIQNAIGAREGDGFEDWKVSIDLVSTDKGSFLTVTDFGTTGITGKNYSVDEIRNLSKGPDEIDGYEKYARISSFYNSGNNEKGGGLNGIGKKMYIAASNPDTLLYYYESIARVEGYRINSNKAGEIWDKAVEGEEGKLVLKQETGLDPIDHIGTRFIIVNPKKELVDAILSGQMESYIKETWWRAILLCDQEHKSFDNGIFLNGKKIEVPDLYKADYDFEHSWLSSGIQKSSHGRQIRNAGFFITKEPIGEEDLRGFSYYRFFMKIATIEPEFVPDKVKNRFYGFVELDRKWEKELEKLENVTHYGLVQGMWKTECFSDLREYVQSLISDRLKEWGYIQPTNSQNARFGALSQEIKQEIQSLFNEQGYQPLGNGEEKSDFTFRINQIVFPHPDQSRTVFDNDEIRVTYTLFNKYNPKSHFSVLVKSVCFETGKSVDAANDHFSITAGNNAAGSVSFVVSPETAEKNMANTLEFTVLADGEKRPYAQRKIVFYYATPTIKNEEKDFSLNMFNANYPNPPSKRVNTGQSICAIRFRANNNTEKDVPVSLLISTLNRDQTGRNEVIQSLQPMDFLIKAGQTIETEPFDLNFSKDVYESVVKKGQIEIRARLVAKANADPYEEGDFLSKIKYNVFFNMDDKKGIQNSFNLQIGDFPTEHRRSWIDGDVGKWSIFVNVAFPEYKTIGSEPLENDYIRKETITQFQLIYLREGKFDQLHVTGNPNSPDYLARVVTAFKERIDNLWWEKCPK